MTRDPGKPLATVWKVIGTRARPGDQPALPVFVQMVSEPRLQGGSKNEGAESTFGALGGHRRVVSGMLIPGLAGPQSGGQRHSREEGGDGGHVAFRTAERGASVIPPDFLFLGLACLSLLGRLFGGEGACGNSQHAREVSISPPVEIFPKSDQMFKQINK